MFALAQLSQTAADFQWGHNNYLPVFIKSTSIVKQKPEEVNHFIRGLNARRNIAMPPTISQSVGSQLLRRGAPVRIRKNALKVIMIP